MPSRDRVGVGVSAVDMPRTVQVIDSWIARRESRYVCVTGVHGVMESRRQDSLRRIHNDAGLVVPDGMPLVWLSCAHGHAQVSRVYGPDLMLAICGVSPMRGYRHFLYGGAEGVADLLGQRLQARFPGLSIVGHYSPPFRPLSEAEDRDVVRMINDTNPDIVWIGLGCPKQEHWMAEHVGRLSGSVLIGVGAAFDFHAGVKRQAPSWMQRSGLEWFFCLVTDPRRLAARYLLGNPAFLWRVALQASGARRHAIT